MDQSFVASLAAIITILALAIEPFTQQIIRYPTKPSTAANVSAVIGTTSVLDPTNIDDAADELKGILVPIDS